MSKSMITVGGIKADLTIDGDNQRFVYNNTSPNNSLEIRSSFVPAANIPVTMRQSSININLSGYEWVQKTQAGENAGTYTLRQTLNAGADTTDIMRINENKTVTFLVPTNIDPATTTLTGAVTGTGTGTITTSYNTTLFNAQVATNRLNSLAVPNGTVDMNSNRIVQLQSPINPSDASNKQYTDATASAAVAARTTTLTGAVTGSSTGNSIATSYNTTAFNAQVATNRLNNLTAASGNYSMGGNKITGVGTPTVSTDVSTMGYADSTASAAVAARTTTLTGAVTGSNTGNSITTSYDTTAFNAQVATNRLNNLTAANGDYSIGNNKITDVAIPILGTDVANKTYVDNTAYKYNGTLTTTNNAGSVPVSANASNILALPSSGTYFGGFDSPTNGRLRYTGVGARTFVANFCLNFYTTTAAQITFYITKNGIVGSIPFEYGFGSYITYQVWAMSMDAPPIILNTNDYVQIHYKSSTANNMFFQNLLFSVKET